MSAWRAAKKALFVPVMSLVPITTQCRVVPLLPLPPLPCPNDTPKTGQLKTLDELEGFVMTAESESGDARDVALSDAAKSVKRLAGMKRSYNLEVKLLKDPASKVCGKPGQRGRLSIFVASNAPSSLEIRCILEARAGLKAFSSDLVPSKGQFFSNTTLRFGGKSSSKWSILIGQFWELENGGGWGGRMASAAGYALV